jgi:hypothetical protein
VVCANNRSLTSGQVARIFRCRVQAVGGMVDDGTLVGYRLPGTEHRRVTIESAIACARENQMHFALSELEDLGAAAGLTVSRLPALLLLSPSPQLLYPFTEAGFDAAQAPGYFRAVELLWQRSFRVLVVDQAIGTAQMSEVGADLPKRYHGLMLAALVNEDSDARTWQGAGYAHAWQKPVHMAIVADKLLAACTGAASHTGQREVATDAPVAKRASRGKRQRSG